MPLVSLERLDALVRGALAQAGASGEMAAATAAALVSAEAQGLASHGLSRVAQYATHLRNGRAVGTAAPRIVNEKPAACLVDAGNGLAFAACALAVRECIARAKANGVAFAGVTNSHHFGAAAFHLMPAADAGLVALAFGNSPAAMPMHGGRRALFGTNPIAAAFPRRGEPPLVVDLSLSEVARGKLMVAAKKGESIPLGWALDKAGNPTTDPNKGLEGSMAPAGGYKGFGQGLIVEVMCAALAGAFRGPQMGSFMANDGKPIGCGQFFIALAPDGFSGGQFAKQVTALAKSITSQKGARLPNSRRAANQKRLAREGLPLGKALYERLKSFT